MSAQNPKAAPLDLAALLAADPAGRGPRPYFLPDPAVERVLDVTLALAAELAVTRQRLDTLERVLGAQGVLRADTIDRHEHGPEAEAERARWQQDYLARVLRPLLDDPVGPGAPPASAR